MKIVKLDENTANEISNMSDQFDGLSLYEGIQTITVKDWLDKTSALNYETHGLIIDGKCIAVASVGDARDFRMAVWKEIMSVYVHPDFKDVKYGSLLINNIVDRIDKRGYENTYVWVMEEDQEARDFFELQNIIPNGNRERRIVANEEEEFLRYVYVNL